MKKRISHTVFILFLITTTTIQLCNAQEQTEKWGIFELSLHHIPKGNPFIQDSLSAIFTKGDKKILVHGFYDGENIYKIRFMPTEVGEYGYITRSNVEEISGISGSFKCLEPSSNNHGPVQVKKQYHFEYADGTPYFPFGTTCYSLVHQTDSIEAKSLAELTKSPFNKVRFCVFPQWQDYSKVTPKFPFQKIKESDSVDCHSWNFEMFNLDFFHHLENRIDSLLSKGIEADLILFHPYDEGHWGFDKMSREIDLFYLKYLIARLSAYRNVWWSLANEYDFLRKKSMDDWDAILETVCENDPFNHLCSCHNAKQYYNNYDPRLTHASIQNGALVEDFGRANILRDAYKKPVIYDEICYEGDIVYRWGNLSGEELSSRFWQALIAGTYASHGEVLTGNDSILHLVTGSKLKGDSPERIRFLRKIVEESGALELVDHFWEFNNLAVSEKGDILIYFGKNVKKEWPFVLPKEINIPKGTKYKAEIIDTWNMTITSFEGIFETTEIQKYNIKDSENKSIQLPPKQYLAIRLRKL